MPTLPQFDSDQYSITSSADLGAHLRVKIDASGEIVLAAAADAAVGYLTERGAAANEMAAVRSNRAPSSVVVAAKAIAVGDVVYAAAGGKVTDAATGVQLGYALTAAAADGDYLLLLAGDETA